MIEKIEALLSKLPPGDQAKLLEQLDEYKRAIEREKCQGSFMSFVKVMGLEVVGKEKDAKGNRYRDWETDRKSVV